MRRRYILRTDPDVVGVYDPRHGSWSEMTMDGPAEPMKFWETISTHEPLIVTIKKGNGVGTEAHWDWLMSKGRATVMSMVESAQA